MLTGTEPGPRRAGLPRRRSPASFLAHRLTPPRPNPRACVPASWTGQAESHGLQRVTEDHGRAPAQVSHPKLYALWGVSPGHIPLVTGVSGPGSQTHPAAASILEGHPELPQLTSGPGPQGPQLRPSEGVARQPVRHGHRSTRCGPRWGMSPGPLGLPPAHTPESLPQHTQAGVRSPSFAHALWGLRTELTALCNHQSLSTSLQHGAEEDSPSPEAGHQPPHLARPGFRPPSASWTHASTPPIRPHELQWPGHHPPWQGCTSPSEQPTSCLNQEPQGLPCSAGEARCPGTEDHGGTAEGQRGA